MANIQNAMQITNLKLFIKQQEEKYERGVHITGFSEDNMQ